MAAILGIIRGGKSKWQSQSESTGMAVKIVKPHDPDANGVVRVGYKLDKERLKKITDQAKDIPVCVIAIAGRTGTGKSLFLNMLIQYFEGKGEPGWWKFDNPVEGFEFRGGQKRTTEGIDMWSKPYFVKDKHGAKIAVLLMDTQGSFDNETPYEVMAGILALSILMSSVQIINLKEYILEDDLQNFSVFTKYAQTLSKNVMRNGNQPRQTAMQSLMFLVRDWNFPDFNPFGFDGGKDVLDDALFQVKPRQNSEMKQMRKDIQAIFPDITCFLMPSPGPKAGSKTFKGVLMELDENFVKYMVEFVQDMLMPENLVIKSIDGINITSGYLVNYYMSYAELLTTASVPSPASILEIGVVSANHTARLKALKYNFNEVEKMKTQLVAEGTTYERLMQLLEKSLVASEKRAIKEYDRVLIELAGEGNIRDRIHDEFISALKRQQVYVMDLVRTQKIELDTKRTEKQWKSEIKAAEKAKREAAAKIAAMEREVKEERQAKEREIALLKRDMRKKAGREERWEKEKDKRRAEGWLFSPVTKACKWLWEKC